MAAKIATPCRMLPASLPKVNVNATGTNRMATTSIRFDSGVGFSNGCALWAVKNPPPLVPSCLMATCDAAGPRARRRRSPSSAETST